MANSIFSFLRAGASFYILASFSLDEVGRSFPFKNETSPKLSRTWQITSNLLHHLVAEYVGGGNPICVLHASLVLGL
jgi:hypothetical protein